MRPLSIVALVAMAAGSCQRTEEPNTRSSMEREAQPTVSEGSPRDADAAKATAPDAAARCVVPLADEPPAAKPAASCPTDPSSSPPELGRGYVTFADAPGTPRIGVEVADSEGERERGLMYRTSMPQEQGMLFSWPDERVRSFWMRNTCIPLDMLFIDKNGFITGILEQVPVLNERSRSVPCPAAYVLEVNAGYCRSHGIKPGGRIVLE